MSLLPSVLLFFFVYAPFALCAFIFLWLCPFCSPCFWLSWSMFSCPLCFMFLYYLPILRCVLLSCLVSTPLALCASISPSLYLFWYLSESMSSFVLCASVSIWLFLWYTAEDLCVPNIAYVFLCHFKCIIDTGLYSRCPSKTATGFDSFYLLGFDLRVRTRETLSFNSLLSRSLLSALHWVHSFLYSCLGFIICTFHAF